VNESDYNGYTRLMQAAAGSGGFDIKWWIASEKEMDLEGNRHDF